MRVEFINELIDSSDSIDCIFNELKKIYFQNPEIENMEIEKYYRTTEMKLLKLEKFLLETYYEVYTEKLKKETIDTKPQWLNQLASDNNTLILIMDALSFREAGYIYNQLKRSYSIDFEYEFSAFPSETEHFKEKINLRQLKKEYKFKKINSFENVIIDGDEEIIWTSYPDALIEELKAGKTLKANIIEVIKKTKYVIDEILKKTNKERIIITSDHGYIRTESMYNIKVDTTNLKRFFSGSRYKKNDNDNSRAKQLLDQHLVCENNGIYVPISHFGWPTRGKYSVASHGGLSLTEGITPKLIIRGDR